MVERSERNASALGDPEIINPKVAGFESKERLRSSEMKEDGLHFVERQRGDHNPFKVASFESNERLRSSKIKEDGLLFVLRGKNEGYLRRELIYKVINSCFRENLVQIYF